jgi:Ca2+-binding RTX toxin-like protein
MKGRIGVIAVLATLAAAGPAGAAPPADLNDDGNGKRWRQLAETVGMSPDQVAAVCRARRRDALLRRGRHGGDGADRIDGGASPDDLNGGRGDDFLDGGLHNDSLRGDDGRDTCVSGETRRSSCEA